MSDNAKNLENLIRDMVGDTGPAPEPQEHNRTPRVAHRDRQADTVRQVVQGWPEYREEASAGATGVLVGTVGRDGVPMYAVALKDGRIVWSVYAAQAIRFGTVADALQALGTLRDAMGGRADAMASEGRPVQAEALRMMAANLSVRQ